MKNEIDLDSAEQIFDASVDGTVGLEEEFGVLSLDTLDLAPRFEELQSFAASDPELNASVAGELISSEIEIRSGRGDNWAHARELQVELRRKLFALAVDRGVALSATGTHPWADYRQQKIIDTEHYRRVEDGLRWVASRNNTFSLHVHVGINGVDRAVRVCDRLRSVLPQLLAISSSSPFLDGRDSGLHSVRSQIFTRSFPRCGIPGSFGSWEAFRNYLELLIKTNSIVEYTQVWWSIRPHLSFGTVEVRICDAQPTAEESDALSALITACVLQAARDEDDGVPNKELDVMLLEENLWRAIRFGTEGQMIDFERGTEFPTSEAVDRLLQWTAPIRGELALDPELPLDNSARRQRKMLAQGRTIEEVFTRTVRETNQSYAGGEH